MFFLLPPVTAVLLVAFAVALAWRAWRQRHGRPSTPVAPVGTRPGLVPAALLRGADRTWVVFTTPACRVCREVAAELRAMEASSQVVEVDATREPRLAEAHGATRLPAVLLADRYGRVDARLVGLAEIRAFTAALGGEKLPPPG